MNRVKLQGKLAELVRQEWGNLHHNASISRYWPEFRNDYEATLFWDCLGDRVSQLIEDLRERVKEETGYQLTFYQYGRQSATIAPHEWMRAASCNSFGCLRDELIGYDDDGESARDTLNVLRALRLINETCAAYAKDVPEWWKETKSANGWARRIRAHDGKTAHNVTVWR